MTREEYRRSLLPSFKEAVRKVQQGEPAPQFQESYLNTLMQSAQEGVSERQLIICFTKWIHNFNTGNAYQDFMYLKGELYEAQDALLWETKEAFMKELADVVIYCYGIAQECGFDMDKVIEEKMAYNIQRKYDEEGE